MGKQVRALYHTHPPQQADEQLPGIEWSKVDLLDVFEVEEAFGGIEEVYHCAAIVSFQPAMHQTMLHFNVESTANVVNFCVENAVKKLVYVSSIAAIGKIADEVKIIDEEEQWGETAYKTAYGLSKHLAETEVWRGIGEGLNAVIINPGVILGEGDWGKGSAELVKIAWEQFPFYTKGVTAWVDVVDVVNVLITIMAEPLTGERYIVCENNYSYRDVMQKLAEAMERKPAKYYANRFLTELIWRMGALKSMWSSGRAAITKESAANAHGVTQYSNAKLLQALPEFQYTPFANTISRVTHAFMHSNRGK